MLKHYGVGQELPSSPLVAIAPAVLVDSREQELVIATAEDGLLLFNGRTFRQIVPQDADIRAITSVMPLASGHLLIGTKKRGVLLYDGQKITVLHPTLSGVYVTSLAGTESDLWVGTLNQGVLHWHAGQTETFGEDAGLARSPGAVYRRRGRQDISSAQYLAWLFSSVDAFRALWRLEFLRPPCCQVRRRAESTVCRLRRSGRNCHPTRGAPPQIDRS